MVFIDDLHVNEKGCQINEYLRYLLNTKTCYDTKYNIIKYYKDFNIVVSGNYCNNALSLMNDIDNYRENSSQYEYKNKINDYIRFINTFSIISLNLPITNFVSLYKPTFEFHLRNYIPNTSNITANQYISVLFKLNELLLQEISPTYNNLHYSFSMRDVTKVIQRFNMFLFRGQKAFPTVPAPRYSPAFCSTGTQNRCRRISAHTAQRSAQSKATWSQKSFSCLNLLFFLLTIMN